MVGINELAGLYSERYSRETFDREPKGLYRPMEHILSIPGKRFRPLLLLLSSQAFGGNINEAITAAHAMELFHNFTLIHDDIMDAATLRRGIPTVHERYGVNTSILAGDALFIYAYRYLCAVQPRYLPAVLEVFNKTTIEIMEGQQMDLDFEQRLDVTVDEYLKMIEYKTSVLLACSLQIGAIISGAPAADQAKIFDFGLKLGLSFQIKDDWLDTFGQSAKVGKKPGGDIIQNKKTFLLITLLNDAVDSDRHELEALLDEKDEEKKISGVKVLYEKYNISGKTSAKVNALYNEALLSLESVDLPAEQKANLFSMAEKVHKREF